MKNYRSIKPLVLRKLATLVLVAGSFAAFATLGEGGKKDIPRSSKTLLSARSATVNYKQFSLRSGYNYRGSQVFNTAPESHYIILNRTITLEKGNQTYILPMKKKVILLDHLSFKPGNR